MIRRALFPMAMFIAAPAMGADTDVAAGYEYTDFSDKQGRRDLAMLEVAGKQGRATLIGNLASGRRRYGDGQRWEATRATAIVYYDWNRRVSTRTSATLASDSPVFARRELGNDFNIKLMDRAVLLLGMRHSEYYGGMDANAWTLGASVYLPGWIASYRYTRYDLSNGGDSYGNVLSLKRKDKAGRGSTQLWIGQGTGVYAYDWTSRLQGGRLKSVSLRRMQPYGDALTIGLGIGKAWYETPVTRYEGLSMSAEVRLRW